MKRNGQDAAVRRLHWALAVALGAYSAGIWVGSFRDQGGADFYHFWGIAAARAEGAAVLGTPYVDGPRYAELLNQRADASSDEHFKHANQRRRAIDPTGTPLLYASFALLPADYTRAHAWFRAAQFLSLCAAVMLLCGALGVPLADAAVLAFAIASVYQPVESDVTVGNVGSLQLLACVGLALLARHVGRREGGDAPTIAAMGAALVRHLSALAAAGSVLLALGVALALLKPNLLLVPLALVPFLARTQGRRSFATAVAVSALFGVILVALSSSWMGTSRAWLEWWNFVRGPAGAKMTTYPVAHGNFSSAMLLSGAGSAASPQTTSLLLGATLTLSWLAAAWAGRAGRNLAARAGELFHDPLLLISSALLLTLAAAPLVWFHYCVLALLPCLWLALGGSPKDLSGVLAWISLGMYGGLLAPLVQASGLGLARLEFLAWTVGFAWVPAWCGLLLRLAPGHRDQNRLSAKNPMTKTASHGRFSTLIRDR